MEGGLERKLREFRERQSLEVDPSIVRVPFRCCLCELWRADFQMLDGDGLPICVGCFERCVGALEGSVV